MIVIYQPYTYQIGEYTRLEAEIFDERLRKKYKLYYEVEKAYGKYFCTESADAFLLALLPFAVSTGQDMRINANISPKLLFNTREYLVPFYAAHLSTRPVEVQAAGAVAIKLDNTAFGTGCSLGVDSLSAIYRFSAPTDNPDYRLTHLAYFGCDYVTGADAEVMKPLHVQILAEKNQFADDLRLPAFLISYNVNAIRRDYKLSFIDVGAFFNASCVLSMQKLFRRYAFAGSENIHDIRYFNRIDENLEFLFTPFFSTENTEIILAEPYSQRIEKLERISRNPLTAKYIDVCFNNVRMRTEMSAAAKAGATHPRNCGCCEKCLRTLIAAEAMGYLDFYKDAFDLESYKKHRTGGLMMMVAKSDRFPYYIELYRLVHNKKMPMPFVVRAFDALHLIFPPLGRICLGIQRRLNAKKIFLHRNETESGTDGSR